MMIPSFTDTPSGNESGVFLAVDFGGTNLRCLLIKTELNTIRNKVQRSMVLDPKIPTGEILFSTIASFIVEFLEENKSFLEPRPEVLPVGFTFSFPIQQTSIASGKLIMWTKEFVASGVVGKDVVELLHAELAKRKYEWVKVVALCNDTVGTLCASTTEHPTAKIGVILGTGSNACYQERMEAITKINQEGASSSSSSSSEAASKKMIINMEWGGYDGFPSTPEDDEVNHMTRKQGQQRLEKMVSGRYLPMLVRVCMNKCIRCGWILNCFDQEKIGVWDKNEELSLIEIGKVEHDRSPNMDMARSFIIRFCEDKSLDKNAIPLHEVVLIRSLFHAIVVRSARYAAVAISTLIQHIVTTGEQLEELTVAIDGSVYHKHIGYKEELHASVDKCCKSLMMGPTPPEVHVVGTQDGSGLGAAIIAAVQVAH